MFMYFSSSDYLGWFILLTGSQVAFYLQHPKLVNYGGENNGLSPRLREKVAISLMTSIAKRFYNQTPPLTVNELEAGANRFPPNIGEGPG